MHIQLVSNPESGSYSRATLDHLRAAFEKRGATVTESESSPRQALTVAPNAERVCVVGGDGTLRHCVAAIARCGRPVPLVAYPGGTVNLMQLELQYPREIDDFVDCVLTSGTAREHFAADLNDTLFLTCASVGPDSAAVAGLSERLKRWVGQLAYVIAFLVVLWHWPRPRLQVHANGRVIDCEAVYVAKGRHFAGPWSFAPAARQDAPWLHVVALSRLTRWLYIRFMLAMLLGRDVSRVPGIVVERCTALQIDAAAPVPVQADGDIAAHLPARMAVSALPYAVVR